MDADQNLKGLMGWNAQTGQYEDMVKAGIIDPVKVPSPLLPSLLVLSCCSCLFLLLPVHQLPLLPYKLIDFLLLPLL